MTQKWEIFLDSSKIFVTDLTTNVTTQMERVSNISIKNVETQLSSGSDEISLTKISFHVRKKSDNISLVECFISSDSISEKKIEFTLA